MNNNIMFHSLSIDNFFKNPDLIRKWGLSLKFKKDKDGRWPGERSGLISDIDLNLNNLILSKIFSCYINFKYENVNWETSNMVFQKIKPFSKKKNDIRNIGWIHQDNSWNFAGIIYLTPNIHFESGTSLYKMKEKYKDLKNEMLCQEQKINFYKNKKFDEKKYKKELLFNNGMFVEKVRYNNFYNRMICFDANEYHGARGFYNHNNEERLTIVFFLRNITFSENTILNRFYNDSYNLDKEIENKILKL